MIQNKDTQEEEEKESMYLYIPAAVFALFSIGMIIHMFIR